MNGPRRTAPFLVTVAAVLLHCCLASTCCAGTLYDTSSAMLEKRLLKAAPDDFTFIVMGDSKDSDDVFRKALKVAASYNPLFILHVGDVSPNGSPKEVEHFLELVREGIPDLPLFVARGNHEQKISFLEKIGPLSYTVDSARIGLKLVVTDNADYNLKPAELNYLRGQLDGQRRYQFVAMHIPPKTKRWNWHTFSDGAAELISLAAERRVAAVFYGHVHLYDRAEIQGVPHVISGGAGARLVQAGFPGDPSYHVVVVRVKGGAVSTTMVKVRE